MMDGAKGQRAVGAASCSLQNSYELAGSSCTSPTEPRGLPSGAPARSGSSRSGRPALLPGVLTALRVPALNLGRRACSFSCREGGRSVSQEARASAASEALEDAGSAGPRRVGRWTLGSGALTAWQEDSLLVGAAQGQCLLCRAGCLWDKGGPGFRGWGLCPSSGNLCLEEP